MDVFTKAVGETKLYTFDFAPELATGEALIDAASVVQAWGLDQSDALVLGAPVVESPLVQVECSGGTAGEMYELLCSCATTSGQVLTVSGGVAVR